MKRILSYLSIVLLSASVACSDSSEMDKAYNSVITPGFTFGEEEIIAGITPVTFTNTTTAEGTTVSEYFWHFGFAGEGNWSEEAAPDPIVYNRPGDYTVTLTAWGADGNRATTTRTITVLADNVLPTADFSYSPQMISIGTTVTFTDKSTDSDGEIVSREWLFPDGTTSTDINATYTFEQMGMFNVQLTVTDDRGGSNSTSKAINVRAGDVNAFTLLWSTAVASADALCAASVVAASDMGYIYSVSGDGKMVALNTDGAKVWEYDAMAKDGVYLKSEISYPSVDTDGTVYWVAHGYGGSSSASLVYAFDGATGSVLWKNTTAYAPAARIAFSTPCISPSMVIVGSRGTNGAIRGFEKGTGKNARQAGYTIGGKTGTSETTVPGEVVVSFMGFAPADDPQILVLLAYNTPARSAEGSSIGTTGTWISGGNMGAPMAGKLIGEILDYLGVEKEYTADEAALADLQTPKVTGMTPADAEAALEKKGLDSRTVGEGETVTAQVPAAGSVIPGESTVILYLGGAEPEETGTVPDVTGMSFAAARSKLESAGFFMRAAGAATYLGSSSKAQGQSVAGGETAAIGTIVDVTFSTPQVEDGYLYDG